MPSITPLLIAVSVSNPNSGVSPLRSTRGSLAVYLLRAFSLIVGPGDMLPPRYSPFAETKSKVTHVPMSMIRISRPGCMLFAPIAAASLSEPSVSGVEYLFKIGIGVTPLLNSIIPKGSDSRASINSELISDTVEYMPHEKS